MTPSCSERRVSTHVPADFTHRLLVTLPVTRRLKPALYAVLGRADSCWSLRSTPSSRSVRLQPDSRDVRLKADTTLWKLLSGLRFTAERTLQRARVRGG